MRIEERENTHTQIEWLFIDVQVKWNRMKQINNICVHYRMQNLNFDKLVIIDNKKYIFK